MSVENESKSNLMGWLVCICAGIFFAYELVQMHMLNAISPLLIKDFDINATKFGYLCSTYLMADVIFLLPAGILLDRYSPRKVILAALFICILATFGFGISQNLFQASVCHFFSGIGNAFCFLSCMMLVTKWFPASKRGFVMGVVITIGMLGGVIAQSPFSYLAQSLSWRNAIIVDAIIGVAIFLLIYLVVREPTETESATPSDNSDFFVNLKSAILNPQTLLCGVYTGLMNLPIMVIGAVWGSLFLSQVYNFSLASGSMIASMICMGTILGSSLTGYVSDKLGVRKPLMLWGGILSLVSMLFIMFPYSPSISYFTVLFFLLGLFSSTQILGYPFISENSPPKLVGTAMGVAAVIIMGSACIAQPLSGALIDLHWNGVLSDGAPLYTLENFLNSFSMFPIGFAIACFAVFGLREKRKVLAESK